MASAPNELHSVAAMVELEGIPKAYLSAILNILVRYGVIASRRGPSGGYVLARSPSDITLARVVEVLEGPLFPVVCLGPGSEPCLDCNADCAARWALSSASRAAWSALENIRVADLAHCSHVANDDKRHLNAITDDKRHLPVATNPNQPPKT